MKRALGFSLIAVLLILVSVLLFRFGKRDSEVISPVNQAKVGEKKAAFVNDHDLPLKTGAGKGDRENKSAGTQQERTMTLLDELSGSNRDLVERLNIRLFDDNLEPNTEDCELLGVSKEDAVRLSARLKEVFDDLKNDEFKESRVLKQSDAELIVAVAKLGPEKATQHRQKVQNAFAMTFPPGLADSLSNVFISQRPSVTAALMGKDRVINISAVPEDVLTRTGRSYKIQTFVMREGTDLSESMGNLENYSENTGVLYVEDIPSSLDHLIDPH